MRFLDLVEQQHAMRMLINAVGQETALVEADITRRRADQAADGVALHVFRHVETDQLHAHDVGELFGDFSLADAGRTAEQIAADRLLRLTQARARELDRRRQRVDRSILTEHDALEIVFERAERFGVCLRHGFRRDARHLGDDVFHFLDADDFFAARFRQQHLRRADFIQHVDRLVGQLAVVDVFRGEFYRCFDGVRGVTELVVLLIIRRDAFKDFDCVGHGRLAHVDLLEAAH